LATTTGIGIGWSREEFDAPGVPFERRPLGRPLVSILALAAAGVTQLVLVDSPPNDPREAREWTRALAEGCGRSRDLVG